jgi:hypothetical protein
MTYSDRHEISIEIHPAHCALKNYLDKGLNILGHESTAKHFPYFSYEDRHFLPFLFET